MPLKDPIARKKYFREHYHLLAQKVRDYKESHPCTDCGKQYPYPVMEFDHIGSDKYKSIAEMLTYSWERVLAEIEKCEIVCANCHRLRTHSRSVGETVNAGGLNPLP